MKRLFRLRISDEQLIYLRIVGLSGPRVDDLRVVLRDKPDVALVHQLLQGFLRKRASDLQTLRHH